jgi:DNA invertase Pin-like site-specific DNA recombinase
MKPRRDMRSAGGKENMLIGYARVSTVDQDLSLQRDALTEAGCEHIYTEQLSGAALDRPALKAALQFARKGDALIVWKLDRLVRSVKQLIETVEDLRARGIEFRSLKEAIDTTTGQGLFIFHIFSALAEFERSLIRERTQAGLATARRNGRTGGRRPKLSVDDIKAAKSMLANPDIGVTQIARRLGVSPATLYRYIPAARTVSQRRSQAITEGDQTESIMQNPKPLRKTAAEILALAKKYGVSYTRTADDAWAQGVTRLADDDVTLDDIELLLIELQRTGHLSRPEALRLQVNYLREAKL